MLTKDLRDCEVHFNCPRLKNYVGKYKVQSDHSLSEIDLYENGTFTYYIKPSFSCWVWHELEGKYYVEDDILKLIVLDFGEDVEFQIPPLFQSRIRYIYKNISFN